MPIYIICVHRLTPSALRYSLTDTLRKLLPISAQGVVMAPCCSCDWKSFPRLYVPCVTSSSKSVCQKMEHVFSLHLFYWYELSQQVSTLCHCRNQNFVLKTKSKLPSTGSIKTSSTSRALCHILTKRPRVTDVQLVSPTGGLCAKRPPHYDLIASHKW